MIKIQKATYCGGEFAGFSLEHEKLLVVRRQDCFAKIVKGAEARLADDLMIETGREQDWDNVMKNLSGQWRQNLKGFAISESGDHLATEG